MKRNKTKLEENLIAKGWSLAFKTYFGKHKDKVQNYVYEKEYTKDFERKDGKVAVATWSARAILDSKRGHVEDVLVSSPTTAFVNEFLVSYIFNRIKDVEKEINDCYPPNQNEELTTDEVVEVAEVVSESNE